MIASRTLLSARAFVLFVLLCGSVPSMHAQPYTVKAVYDSLDTRHDLKRPLIERYFITSNHHWACFNRGLIAEARITSKEELELAEQLGIDSLLATASHHVGDAFNGSADAALQLKYFYQGLEYAQRSGIPNYIGTAQKQIATVRLCPFLLHVGISIRGEARTPAGRCPFRTRDRGGGFLPGDDPALWFLVGPGPDAIGGGRHPRCHC
ncbi:MAG: hypothetical protein IPJ85_15205 [Flavobacteriales bacterium]|nr:hypothetical protein [Flavobacteriales bacterium]